MFFSRFSWFFLIAFYFANMGRNTVDKCDYTAILSGFF
jgi:hypothetical protein